MNGSSIIYESSKVGCFEVRIYEDSDDEAFLTEHFGDSARRVNYQSNLSQSEGSFFIVPKDPTTIKLLFSKGIPFTQCAMRESIRVLLEERSRN
ncbi:MAG TPA: hypothetical protein VGC66_19035 [Pyrinomonadaceae bacterium]